VDEALGMLVKNPRYPSLRTTRWFRGRWYARASRDLRMFYEVRDGYYWMIDVGHHDIERGH